MCKDYILKYTEYNKHLITSIIFSKSSKNKTDIRAEGEIVGNEK